MSLHWARLRSVVLISEHSIATRVGLGQDSNTAKPPPTTCAMKPVMVWNQARSAPPPDQRYWAVDERSATPTGAAQGNRPATTGIDGDDSDWRRDCIKPEDAPAYEGGTPIAIRWARLAIGGQTHQCETDPQDTCACFEAVLKPGTDRLYASFHDDVERTIAPYYVYVRKL